MSSREKQEEQMLPLVTAARKQKVELDAQQATVTRLKEEESLLAKKEELLGERSRRKMSFR